MYPFGENKICKCIYSAAEINFINNKITSVTSLELDEKDDSKKQTADLSTKIAQLLVDIKSLGDGELHS